MTDYNVDKKWEVTAAVLNTMGNQVSYALIMGNHDLNKDSDRRDSELFNRYLPCNKYNKTRNFGDAFEEEEIDNAWYTFKAAGLEWLILCLESGPCTSVLDWTGEITKKRPHHKVIISTHIYMYSDDTRMGGGDH